MDPSLRGSICEEITFNYIIDYQGHTLPARSTQLLKLKPGLRTQGGRTNFDQHCFYILSYLTCQTCLYLYSNSCLTDVDLELADDCQYWLEGVILVSDNTN